jgi:membrane-associated phospholipid phosphatase
MGRGFPERDRGKRIAVPLILLLLIALTAGAAVCMLALRYPEGAASRPSLAAAEAAGETIRQHPGLRRKLDGRLDPATATGLALTIALALVVVGGLVLGLLALLVRSNPVLRRIDHSAAQWGNDHAGRLSTRGLELVTDLGEARTVVALALVIAIVEIRRVPSRWIVPFLVVVLAGDGILTLAVKDLMHRARPTLNPIAATLGPSFPSGHTSTAAAFYAAAALLIGRRRGPRARALLAGAAVAIAVGVACSRVLLDVHWVTDVAAGLALGWAWFAICSIAFGGRLLRFGAAVEQAAGAADVSLSADAGANGGPPQAIEREHVAGSGRSR